MLAGGGLELYHWRGSYFIDRARGGGGLYVEQLRIGGYGGDPRFVDLAPPPLRRFLHGTGGGGRISFDVAAEPRCAARVDTAAEASAVYR